jgi:hypothetical protein
MYELLNFSTVSDSRGDLTFINNLKDIPFEIKRVFTIDNVPAGATRGEHAHHELQEVVIPLYGNLWVELTDGLWPQQIELNNPRQGLLLYPHIWRKLYGFSKGSICLVLCSAEHDESDYIRDWNVYLKTYGK